MLAIVNNDFSRIYERIVINLINQKESNSRLGKRKELTNVLFELYNPELCLLKNKERVYSKIILNFEGVLNFFDNNEIKYVPWYKKFIKNKTTTNSTYGQYIAPKITDLISLLIKYPHTNQALLKIDYNDISDESNDFPCTIAIQFKIINKKLNCYVQMRSNDVYYGLPYDVVQFIMLQFVIANELNIKVGTYSHYVTNMHLYKNDYEKIIKEINAGYSYNAIDITNLNLKTVKLIGKRYMEKINEK